MQTKYISADQLATRYGVDRSTIWRWAQRNVLPKPVRIADQCTRWLLEEIEELDSEREEAIAPQRVLDAARASVARRTQAA